MGSKKLKVLISAYACEPHKGSEPGVGWNWSKQIAKFAEAWVITRANNREVIEEELKKNSDPNLHFVYVDLPKWMRFWKKRQIGVRTYYYLWQFVAFKKALEYNKKIRFALSHHVTFVNDWLPSFLALLPIPFIWGPIGSHPSIPLRFLPDNRIKILEIIRRVIQNTFRYFDPFFYITLFRAKSIIMINKRLQRKYPFSLLPQSKIFSISAIGINIDNIRSKTHREKGSNTLKIIIISVGRFIYIKAFHLALKAFAEASKKINDIELNIIGDGMEKGELQTLTHKLGINKHVVFSGNISRGDVLERMVESDIFLFPSFEGGGMVVLEAMTAGLPVVCLDFGGPGEMVTEECGIKVKPITPEQTIKDLADAILKLANDPELRKKMGKAARRRVEEYYSWNKKGEFIQKIYNSLPNRSL